MLLSNAIRQRLISVSKKNGIPLKNACKKTEVSYSTLISFMIGKTKTIKARAKIITRIQIIQRFCRTSVQES